MRLSGGQGSQLSLTVRACVEGNLTKGHFLTRSAQNTAACLLYPNYGESGQMKCGTIYVLQTGIAFACPGKHVLYTSGGCPVAGLHTEGGRTGIFPLQLEFPPPPPPRIRSESKVEYKKFSGGACH